MADTNKRKRKEDYNLQTPTELPLQAKNVAVSTSYSETSAQQCNVQQPIYLNQVPVLQNQQLVYQVEGVQNLNFPNGSNPQNFVYIVIPTPNENAQVETVPVDLLKKDKNSYVIQSSPQKVNSNVHGKTMVEGVDPKHDKYFVDDIQLQAYTNQSLDIPLVDMGNSSELPAAPTRPFEELYMVENPPTATDNNTPDKNVSNIRTHGYKCDYQPCTMAFASVYEKKAHMETHLYPESTEFKCNICNSVFPKAADRNKHVESHTVVNTYKCKNCNLTFPYYTSLVKHIDENKCVSKDKLRGCVFCGSKFVSEKDLAKHHEVNLKTCVCKSKICGEQSFEVHVNLCPAHKNKQSKRKRLKTDVLG